MDRIEKINLLLQITDIDGLLNALDEHLIDLSDEMEIENDLKGQSFNKTITRKSKSLSPLLVFLIIWTLAWETLKRIFIWIGKGISHALSGSSFVATSASVVVLGGASITTYYVSRPLLISYSESSPHISKKQNMENSEIHQERNNNDLGTSKSPDMSTIRTVSEEDAPRTQRDYSHITAVFSSWKTITEYEFNCLGELYRRKQCQVVDSNIIRKWRKHDAYVSFDSAMSYCKRSGGRLPSEKEIRSLKRNKQIEKQWTIRRTRSSFSENGSVKFEPGIEQNGFFCCVPNVP